MSRRKHRLVLWSFAILWVICLVAWGLSLVGIHGISARLGPTDSLDIPVYLGAVEFIFFGLEGKPDAQALEEVRELLDISAAASPGSIWWNAPVFSPERLANLRWLPHFNSQATGIALRHQSVVARTTSIVFPLWIPVLLVGVPLWRYARKVQTMSLDQQTCRQCRYSLTGNTTGRCPECGTPIRSTVSPNGQPT